MAKPPKPYMLTENETLGTFRNWRRALIANLRLETITAPIFTTKSNLGSFDLYITHQGIGR
jgi:hypothetical protein